MDQHWGVLPLTVHFTNLSTGPITQYQWQFGDGATSTHTDPIHTYTNVGIFRVTLTAYGIDKKIEITSQPKFVVALLGCPITSLLNNHQNIAIIR